MSTDSRSFTDVFRKGYLILTAGREAAKMCSVADALVCLLWHESGHAIMRLHLGEPVHKLIVTERGGSVLGSPGAAPQVRATDAQKKEGLEWLYTDVQGAAPDVARLKAECWQILDSRRAALEALVCELRCRVVEQGLPVEISGEEIAEIWGNTK